MINSKEILYLCGDAYSAPAVMVKSRGNWNMYYIGRDYLGSITHIIREDGTVQQELSYDAWGNLNPTPTLPAGEGELFLGRGYTGHEHLQQFGLINMNARLYDNAIGRFLSPDKVEQDPENKQNLNRYSYCLNNPLKYTDITGNTITMWGDSMVYQYNDMGEIIGGQRVPVFLTYGQDSYGHYGFIMSNGAMYNGTNAYVLAVTAALNSLRIGGINGRALVNELMKPGNMVEINLGMGRSNHTYMERGSYIVWNPAITYGGPNQSGSTYRPSYIGLGHEMAHVLDIWNGTVDRSYWFKAGEKTVTKAEIYATHVENMLRAENGLPLRTMYQEGYNKSSIIDAKNGTSLYYITSVTFSEKYILGSYYPETVTIYFPYNYNSWQHY